VRSCCGVAAGLLLGAGFVSWFGFGAGLVFGVGLGFVVGGVAGVVSVGCVGLAVGGLFVGVEDLVGSDLLAVVPGCDSLRFGAAVGLAVVIFLPLKSPGFGVAVIAGLPPLADAN
jgi:hypothetical protein